VTRRGPRGELFSLIARRASGPALVYVGDQFARHGKPVLFPTLTAAKATARVMQRQYPTLRGYSIWAREV